MEVLVTGGAGFIGSNLVHYLCKHRPDWQVVVIDNLSYSGNFKNIEAVVQSGKVDFVKADICDDAAVNSLFSSRNFEFVFHLAAESHVDRSILSARPFVQTNVVGTQVLVDAFRAKNRGRFIHVSTDEVYGSLGPTGKFHETTPLDPTSPYSASKAGSDLMALAAAKTHDLDIIVTRCTNNYGPYQFPEKFIPLFTTNALEGKELPLYGDGRNIRSWLYVDDHCEALLRVAEGGKAGEVYNIGGGDEAELSNKFVAQEIVKALGKDVSMIKPVADRLAHDLRYAIDYSKIEDALGWRPSVPFEQGLEITIEWYKANESWWRDIKAGDYREFYQQNYESRSAAN